MSKETGRQVSKRCHITHNSYITQCFHKSNISLSQKMIISLLTLALGPMLEITVFLFAVVALKYSSVLFLILKYFLSSEFIIISLPTNPFLPPTPPIYVLHPAFSRSNSWLLFLRFLILNSALECLPSATRYFGSLSPSSNLTHVTMLR